MDIPVALKTIIEALIGPRLDRLALYTAKVVAQSSDLRTVEVVPDDSRIPGTTGVPIYLGTPGVKCKIPPGTRVLMGFKADGLPYVQLWEAVSPLPEDTTVEASKTVTVKGPDGVVVDSSSVKLGKNAAQGVARLGDTVVVTVAGVTPGPGTVVATGTITAGSSKVFAE